jgi:cytoskeletal protein CcmA (bactofilin family)
MPDSPRRRLIDRLAATPTVIGPDTRLEGELHTAGSVIIAGQIAGDGDIGGTLSLLLGAHWMGDVHAASAAIAGRVTGDLLIDGKLELAKTSVIEGDVRARECAIAHGALVQGVLTVTGEAPVLRFEDRRGPSEPRD